MKLSDIAGDVAPVERTVPLALDGGAAERINQLLRESTQAEASGDTERARELVDQIEEIGQGVRVVNFTFRQIDPERYTEILDDCPPSEQQRAKGLPYDDRKLRPVIVREAMVDPEPDDGFDDFWRSLSWGQQQTLYDAAWGVNVDPVDIPFVQAASKITQFSAKTSPTAPQKASRGRSSGGGKSASTRKSSSGTKKAARSGG